jgi:hypothetical protein
MNISLSIEIIPEEELSSPEDHVSFEDNPDFAKTVHKYIKEYGIWGWCFVIVRASFGIFQGKSCLGSCCYKDEEDFKKGGYYEQLRDEAIADLEKQIEEARNTILAWDQINK